MFLRVKDKLLNLDGIQSIGRTGAAIVAARMPPVAANEVLLTCANEAEAQRLLVELSESLQAVHLGPD